MQSSGENPGLDGPAPAGGINAAVGLHRRARLDRVRHCGRHRLLANGPPGKPGRRSLCRAGSIALLSRSRHHLLRRADAGARLAQGALATGAMQAAGMTMAERKRFLIVLGLCLAFSVVLVGHGLPFWLAAAIFVSATISVLQYPQRRAADQVCAASRCRS